MTKDVVKLNDAIETLQIDLETFQNVHDTSLTNCNCFQWKLSTAENCIEDEENFGVNKQFCNC